MDDYFLRVGNGLKSRFPDLNSWRDRFKGVTRTKKINILTIFVLVLCMRLFFYAISSDPARAEHFPRNGLVDPEVLDPMTRIREDGSILPILDSEGVLYSFDSQVVMAHGEKKEEADNDKIKEEDILQIIKGYPMEKMAPYIAKRDKRVAAFLVGIAKKESGWGEHAPRRSGRDCYNYWGYKGSYKLVQGYSCFDSPEQAVSEVGDRIEKLIEKGKNTPEKFLVWKCGSSCDGHDPEGVRSWIGTVRQYWQKMLS